MSVGVVSIHRDITSFPLCPKMFLKLTREAVLIVFYFLKHNVLQPWIYLIKATVLFQIKEEVCPQIQSREKRWDCHLRK